MPLILITAAIPDDAYWGPVPSGVEGWSEDGSFNLYPNTSELQDLGLPTKRVKQVYGVNAHVGNRRVGGSHAAIYTSIAVGYHNVDCKANGEAQYGSMLVMHGVGGDPAAYASLTYAKYGSLAISMFGPNTTHIGGARVNAYNGSLACGKVLDTGFISGRKGSLALGIVTNYTSIRSDYGSLAVGYSKSYGQGIFAAHGSLAIGYAGTAGEINARARGSAAIGHAQNGEIVAGSFGSQAIGNANGYNIVTSASGSMALGYASTAHIYASALGAVQINSGTNSTANSLKVGADTTGIRAIGSGVVSLRDGDIWCDGTDVFVRTSGGIKNLSNIP